jgi:hypothetical protein
MSYGVLPEKADEEVILDQIDAKNKLREQTAATATPQLAARIGEIYRANPWMKPGEILALAKAGASDQLVNAASTQSGKQLPARLDPNPPRKKGWFERTFYDPLKSAARYTFATLNLAPELAQNVGSQLLNKDNPEGFDGWFKSTSLGTMLAASKGEIDPNTGQPITAGEGYFLGGTAAEKQSERARRFRGTINGSAWTLGRGAADVVFAPGSKAYNILSGFVDASVAVFADPTLYGGKALKAARAGRAAIPALQTADEIAAFQKVAAAGERAAAGLSQAETVAWNGSKFRQWFETNGKARRLTETLVEKDDAYDIFSNVFKEKIDIASANRLAKAKTRDEVLAIVGEQANRMDAELSGIFPTDIRDIVKARERLPFWNNIRNSELLTKMPDAVIKVGTTQDSVNAVKNYGRYVKSLGKAIPEDEARVFMSNVMETFADPTAAGAKQVNDLFENLVTKVIKNELSTGALAVAPEQADEIAKQTFARVAKIKDELRSFLQNEAGELDDFGLMQSLIDSGHLIAGDDVNPTIIKNLRLAGPGSLVELADKVQVLPDVRVIRRLTANPFVRRALSKRAGDPRAATVVTDYLQNEIWKPLTLMTGGYIFRNMFDAQIRMAAVGKAGFFNHPFRYMQLVLNKTMPEGFVGRGSIDDGIEELVRTFGDYTDTFEEAMSFGLRRNLDDPSKAYERGIRNGSFAFARKTGDKEQYLRGLSEELRRLSQDQINNAVAKGIPTDELVTWLRRTDNPQAVKSLRRLQRYLKGGLDGYDIVNNQHYLVRLANGEVNDDLLAQWIERLGNPRINAMTGGDETLRWAIANRRMPLAASETIDPRNLKDTDFIGGRLRQGVGSEISLGVENGRPIVGVVTAVNSDTSWTVRRLSDFDIWDTDIGAKEFQNYLAGVYATPGNSLPRWVKYAQEVGVPTPAGVTQKDMQILGLKNRAVDWFFDGAYGKLSRKFERSPVYRQFYYEQFIENADLLSPEEARLFRQSIPGRAAYLNMTPEAVFGGKKKYQELLAKLDSAEKNFTKVPFDVGTTPTPSNPSGGVLFHGSANPLKNNKFEDIMDIYTPDAYNLFGRGVYLTDSPKVAASYSRKGATATKTIDGLKVGEQGIVYNTRLASDAKMLDLTQPNASVRNKIRDITESTPFQNFLEDSNVDLGEYRNLVQQLAKDDVPAENLIAAFKASMKGGALYEVDEFVLELTEDMRKYADVLSYRGGVRVGKLGEHNAYVVLNTNKLSIERSTDIGGFMENVVAGVSKAATVGTVKQLEDYAGLRALNLTKETLFNATERSNLEDIFRIIIPFGAAWREILGTYGKFLYEDPTKIRRAQLVYNGAVNFDPDNDGQGFFYKDPITGQNTFNIPFSGDLAKLLTGVNAPLQAPVKGLSMGLQVIPAIGPVAQIAASELIPDTPSTDAIVEILLPYGRKKPGALVPGYVTKAYSALRDNPGKTESIYGNTYTETVRALSASGEYNLDDPAEKERLLDDAKWRARVLTGFRALSQFLGPTSGTPEAIVETNKGDIYASYLLKAFQDLQTENYDTAVKRFLEIYGDDALLYVSSKTQAQQPGIAATEQFGDWERKNRDVMEAFPQVAAYFAPGGDDFSFSVWERQIRTGARKRLTASEMIDLAQFRVGNAIYRDLKKQAGQYPPQEVKDWLRNARQKIHEKLPGFPAQPVFTVGEFQRNIQEMKRAVQDPRLADNEVAGAAAEYLRYRDQAIAEYVAAGGKEGGFATAKQAADLRQWLFNIGNALSEAVPEFQRVWDRELASEVDEL